MSVPISLPTNLKPCLHTLHSCIPIAFPTSKPISLPFNLTPSVSLYLLTYLPNYQPTYLLTDVMDDDPTYIINDVNLPNQPYLPTNLAKSLPTSLSNVMYCHTYLFIYL